MASFAVYSHGLGGQFTNWDDNWLITENRHIRGLSWQNIQTMFNPMAPREELGNEYLPVRDLSYAFNYALDGLRPRGYHATNLLLHVFNSLLVMLLAARLTGRRLIGGLAGLVFAIHPVHVEAVSWLSSRKDLLATFFLLAGTHFYLAARRSRDHLMPSQSFILRVRQNTRLSFGLALVCYLLALLSKMPAVVLPALLVLIELFFGHGLGRATVPRRLVWTAPFWGVAALFTLLAMKIGTGLMREPYGDGRLQSTLTAISAITRDFQLMFVGWPTQAAVDMPVQTGLSLSVVIGLLLLLGMVVLGSLGWRASRNGFHGRSGIVLGMCGFGGLWFLISLAPVSNFAVQIGTVFAERYLYIPSIGVALAFATLAALGTEALKGPARFAPVALLALACTAWGLLTVQSVKPWHNSTTLWAHALSLDPTNHTAWFNSGREKQEQALVEADDARRSELFQGAMHDYEQALKNPARTYRYDPARVYIAMASVCLQREQPKEAAALLSSARDAVDQPWRSRANPAHEARVRDIEAIEANYRGLTLSALGEYDKAVAAFREAVSKSDRYSSARINLAAELGRKALAGVVIDQELLGQAWRELAAYEHSRGRDEASIEQRARLRYAEFNRRLELSGAGAETVVPADLAPLLSECRDLYTELLALREGGAMSRRARARTYVEAAEVMARGRTGDVRAEELLRHALELDPQFVGLRTLLARFLFEKTGRDTRTTLEANRLLAEELKQHPNHKPALQLKAAGLRQTAVDHAAALRKRWMADYVKARNDSNPTWQGFITAFFQVKELRPASEEFSRGLLSVVALLRQAIETDPDNAEGHALIEGTGLPIALGMWFTRVPNLRGNAEDLLRTGFNAKPEDGPLAGVLSQFYLELAEEVVNPRIQPQDDQQRQELREGLNELLANMLSLSERARQLLSRKLYEVGRDVEDGRRAVANAEGEITELSVLARGMIAVEFMQAATLLDTSNVTALDWLKRYYQEEGNLPEAVKVFEQLVATLKDKPQLLHGVNLSLAQLQADLGQQMRAAFLRNSRLGQDALARDFHEKAVKAYLDCLATTDQLLEAAGDSGENLNNTVRLRGISAQRLAQMQLSHAEKYYTIALDAYGLLPLDFPTEINEVRRRRVAFFRDPHSRLRELRELERSTAPGPDSERVKADIRDLERHLARLEAIDLQAQGRLQDAMDKIAPHMSQPSSALYATRGDIHAAMARTHSGEERARLLLLAAQDYVAATTDATALLKGARLYWQEEALIHQPGRISMASAALTRAETLIREVVENPDSPKPPDEVVVLQKQAADLRAEMNRLAEGRLAGARRLLEDGKYAQALPFAREAVEMQADYWRAYQLLGQIQRGLGRTSEGEPARKWFQEACGSFEIALKFDIPLASQRLTLQYDLAETLGIDLKDRKGARDWIYFAREVLKQRAPALEPVEGESETDRKRREDLERNLDDVHRQLQTTWTPRLDELESRISG